MHVYIYIGRGVFVVYVQNNIIGIRIFLAYVTIRIFRNVFVEGQVWTIPSMIRIVDV